MVDVVASDINVVVCAVVVVTDVVVEGIDDLSYG